MTDRITVTIPVKGSKSLAALGASLGARLPDDKHLRKVTLPAGWSGDETFGKRHGVCDHLIDQHGRTRANIGWTIHLTNVEQNLGYETAVLVLIPLHVYAMGVAEHGDRLVMDDAWATPAAMADVVSERIRTLRHLVDASDRSIARWGDHWLGEYFGQASDQRRQRAEKLAANEVLLGCVQVAAMPTTSTA
jgi:hypothetical protein